MAMLVQVLSVEDLYRKYSLLLSFLLHLGGHAQHIGSAREKFPVFKHVLPEVVLAGHTNSGKSTLVNALAGIHPRTGI